MNNAFSFVKNRSTSFIQTNLRNNPDFLKSAIPFVIALLMQFLVLASGSLKGLGALPFKAWWIIVVMDLFAVVLRLATERSFDPVIAYAPQTLLCFGICIKSTECAVRNYADSALEMQSNIHHMFGALIVYFAAFFLFGVIAWAMENIPYAKAVILALMIALPLLTLLCGTKQNDAKTAFHGVQIYQFVLLGFVFLASSVFQWRSTPGKRSSFFIVYLAILSVLFYFMREFGTLLVLFVATIVAILTDSDLGKLRLFWSGGFGVIGNIVSAIIRFFRSKVDRLFDRILPTADDRSRRNIRRAVFWLLVVMIGLMIGIYIISGFSHLITNFQDLYHRKVEMKVYPWLNIGNSIDDHQEALAKCFANGGLFGKNVIECVFPPHFHEDCTLAMVFQLFGWLMGIVFVGIYFLFLLRAHMVCSRSVNRLFYGMEDVPIADKLAGSKKYRLPGRPVNTARYALTATILLGTQALIPMGSAVKLFPIIGISTPMLSGGGVQYFVFFILLGIIMNQTYTAATDTLPPISHQREKISPKQWIKKIFFSKLSIILLIVLVSFVVVISFCLWLASGSFNSYLIEKADIMNRIDYHYSPEDKYPPPKEVADIPIADDPDVHNVLIIGLDNASSGKKASEEARSDSMILISLNRKKHTIKQFSLQRDTYLRFANGQSEKLNAAYKFGGMQLLADTIKMNYRIPVHTTCRIDRSKFQKIIDAMGGIELEISNVEADYLNNRPGECELDREYDILTAGKCHLDGWQTLEYVRMRHSTIADNDYNRAGRQQQAISAIIVRLSKLGINGDMNGLKKAIDAMAKEVDTNISGKEVNEILPDAALSLIKVTGPDGKPDIEKYHIPDRYYSNSYFEHNAWRLKPDLRRTVRFLRLEIYGEESLVGIEK